MQAQEHNTVPAQPGSSNHAPNSIEPVRADGQAALDTHDVPGMTGAKLLQVDIAWSNLSLDVTTLTADNLLADPPGAKPPRIPKCGNLFHSLFALFFLGLSQPVKVHVTPDKVYFEDATDHPGAREWLFKRHFTSAIDFAKKTALILLTIAGTLSPFPDDDDTDDGDDHKIYAAFVT